MELLGTRGNISYIINNDEKLEKIFFRRFTFSQIREDLSRGFIGVKRFIFFEVYDEKH